MNFLKIEIIKDLAEKYEGELCHYSNKDDWKINVFIYKSTSENIEKNWRKIASSISVVYQSELIKLEDEFEKWNFYIFFISTSEITKELKNLIETNRFSSRKVVEDNYTEDLSDATANLLITKHIINDDLVSFLNINRNKTENNYTPVNKLLWDKIPLENIKRDIIKQGSIINDIKLSTDEN